MGGSVGVSMHIYSRLKWRVAIGRSLKEVCSKSTNYEDSLKLRKKDLMDWVETHRKKRSTTTTVQEFEKLFEHLSTLDGNEVGTLGNEVWDSQWTGPL